MSDLIEFLHPPIEPVEKLDCEWARGQSARLTEFVATRQVSDTIDNESQCGSAASIRVDGKWYCGTHAKGAALEYLIKNQFKL